MAGLRLAAEKAADPLLDCTIRLGDALVLAQMLEPRLDQKGFHESAPLGCVFEDAPGIRSVSAALGGKTIKCVRNCSRLSGMHLILDGHQHRPRIVFDSTDDHGCRPVQ